MSARHHKSGRFATRGPRPSRTEIERGTNPHKPSTANAAFNEQTRRANAAGAVATAGQVVATTKVS